VQEKLVNSTAEKTALQLPLAGLPATVFCTDEGPQLTLTSISVQSVTVPETIRDVRVPPDSVATTFEMLIEQAIMPPDSIVLDYRRAKLITGE